MKIMKLKELKKNSYFQPHLGPYEGRWKAPTYQKVEYNRKKRAWVCHEIYGKRVVYFYPNEEIIEVSIDKKNST